MSRYTAQDIKNAFTETISDGDKFVQECLSMCHNFNLNPEDLRWKLEAINFKPSATHSEISPFTIESVIALKNQMQRDLNKKEKKVQSRPAAVSANVNRMRMPLGSARNTASMAAKAIPVAQVKREPGLGAQIPGPSKVVFSGPSQDEESKKLRAYRYMFERQLERSERLDQMIDDAAELVRAHYKLDDIGDPGTTTDTDVVIVGRIFLDDEVKDLKLTEATTFLESSRMLSGGARIALKFDPSLVIRNNIRGAKGVGLFPGAIVALRGKNGGGGYFLVQEILGLPLPNPPSLISDGDAMKVDSAPSGPFSLAIACGPFTTYSDLDYTPWSSLVERLRNDKPSTILLIGPFIDSFHPSVKSGDLDHSPSELFQRRIYRPLSALLDASPGTIAILIPSVRDLISSHAVYPQSELTEDLVNKDPRIKLLPNPARFKINDISFGACSVDVLFHLRREEYVKTGKELDPCIPLYEDDVGTDVMANLCRHLLQQRSFYPLFPTPEDLPHEVNLDITHSNGLKLINKAEPYPPDVLILPSKLKHFVKTVHNATAINPSFVDRGTYALLKVAEGGPLNIKQRLGCEILRLTK